MLPFLLLTLLLPGRVTVSAFSLPSNCTPGVLMTTPSYGLKNAVFTVCASDVILDPQRLTYDVLLDFTKYHLWNSFVTSVVVPPTVTSANDVFVGMLMTLFSAGLTPVGTAPSEEVITFLEGSAEPPFVAWKYDIGSESMGLSEHVSLLVSLDDDTIRYVSWETYYGPGALLLQETLQTNLQTQFEVQGVDLNQRVKALTG